MTNKTPTVSHVTLVACNGVLGTSLGITTDLYALLSNFMKFNGKDFTIELVSVNGEPILTQGDLTVQIHKGIDDIEETQLVMIPPFWGDIEATLKQQNNFIPWLQKQYKNGAILVAHATAVFFLAEAGLLNGKRSTTHWMYINKLEKNYPKINVCRQQHITAEDNIYCSAGLSSAMDLGLHLIEHLWGKKLAKILEDNFVADFRRGYESPLIDFDGEKHHGDKIVLKIQQWMELNFTKSTDLETLSKRFEISLRSLKRRFKIATGETPLGYQQRLRIEKAKILLKADALAISQVSHAVGYEDISYFGSLFKRTTGLTPNQFRKTAHSKNSTYLA